MPYNYNPNDSMLPVNHVHFENKLAFLCACYSDHEQLLFTWRCISLPHKAPARPSRVTCQVKLSPLTFSASSSFWERGNTFLQSSSIFGKW